MTTPIEEINKDLYAIKVFGIFNYAIKKVEEKDRLKFVKKCLSFVNNSSK